MIKKLFFIIFITLLFYSRFVGLTWGLPYPMHPDERNMAVVVQQLKCETFELKECLNPNFFAYGQLPLYTSFVLIKAFRLLLLQPFSSPVTFEEATISLRFISAFSSILTVLILYKIIENILVNKEELNFLSRAIVFLSLSFTPFSIQIAHFGTTESLLIAIYSGIYRKAKKENKHLYSFKDIGNVTIYTGN